MWTESSWDGTKKKLKYHFENTCIGHEAGDKKENKNKHKTKHHTIHHSNYSSVF